MLPVGGESPAVIQGDLMKKTPKKLTLTKETLQALGEAELTAPHGGTLSVYRPCFATEAPSCRC